MYQIRKCESVTTLYGSEVANLDPEKFKDLSIPYKGNSEMEFLNYLSELFMSYDDMISELEEKLGEEVFEELYKLYGTPNNPYWYSTTKGSDEWYEMGKVDKDDNRNGGFETDFRT
jgi:hypothetical protein